MAGAWEELSDPRAFSREYFDCNDAITGFGIAARFVGRAVFVGAVIGLRRDDILREAELGDGSLL